MNSHGGREHPPAAAPTADELAPGVEIELDIGPVAHGGHCVARHDGRVIFVRLALPGERALVRITEARPGSFCRGEAIAVRSADPRRVDAPCSHFGPGGCGGCDFQHAAPALQRELKGAVVAEQLRRLAGLDIPVEVEALPGGEFGWRSRVRWALDPDGRIGPRAVRSHRVVPISERQPCLIATPEITAAVDVLDVPPWVRRAAPRPPRASRAKGPERRGGRRAAASALPEVLLARAADGAVTPTWPGRGAPESPVLTEHAAGQDFVVAADGFWQPHRAAADVLADAVAEALTGIDLAGRVVWDLYGGVGLFTAVLADAVGPDGAVVCVESDERAAALAADNLAGHPGVGVRAADVRTVLPELDPDVAAVVLDPPRSGAGPGVCADIAARRPDVIVYVACDPAALARDTAALLAGGYRLAGLRAFDTFPQTHHVECVARFVPASS
ncbi:class I SAM-dependent RNA methyltransferase [Nakamurella sp.]|uniref:class I SAM-dependent RNA methyltransferase n=1 Tax=Nakamurella sp. TaxID=1869182 RepID=UPI003783B9B2